MNERLREMADERGWTMYRLAKESNVAWSTVRNMFERNTLPTIPTLEALCAGMQMTLEEFFAEHPGNPSREYKPLIDQLNALTPRDRQIVMDLVASLSKK